MGPLTSSSASLAGWASDVRAGTMGFHALTGVANALGINVSLEDLVTVSGEAFALGWSESLSAADLTSLRREPTWLNGARALGMQVEIHQEKNPGLFARKVRDQLSLGRFVVAPIFDYGRLGVINWVDENMCLSAVGPDCLVSKPTPPAGDGMLRVPGGTVAVADGYAIVDVSQAAISDYGFSYDRARTMVASYQRSQDSRWPQDAMFGVMAAEAVASVIRREMLADMDMIARLLVFAEQTEFGFECVERWLSRQGSDGALRRLGRQARSVRAAAGELAERLWDRNGHRSPRDLARAVTSRKSMVFEMPMDISSQHVPGQVIELPRGRAVIVQSERRLSSLARLADLLVTTIKNFDRQLIG